jgi:BolA protein
MGELWDGAVKRQENELLDFIHRPEILAPMPVTDAITDKLAAAFAPSRLEVEDESARHAGHAGAVRADGGVGETHFRVTLVSAAFAGLSRVERHRRVHAVLAEELKGPVHALTVRAFAPGEV